MNNDLIFIILIFSFILLQYYIDNSSENFDNTNNSNMENIKKLSKKITLFNINDGKIEDDTLIIMDNLKYNATMQSKGNLKLQSDEIKISNKSGVIIGKEWKGNGNLTINGNNIPPSLNLPNGWKIDITDNNLNFTPLHI